jgi:uncharacterized protein
VRRVLVDTGFWVALANPRDVYHDAAASALRANKDPLITTWPVLAEACRLLIKRLGPEAQEALIEAGIRGAYDVFGLEPRHLPRVRELLEHYRTLPMDLADASLVILAEELGTGRIFSTDQRDFGTYRWKRHKPFTSLLPERAR